MTPFFVSSIFRCTLNKIPETKALLQKSRLPLGILIHPFKDLTVSVSAYSMCSCSLIIVPTYTYL
jgi:protein transport protein SEC24